ncbi:hypothetical protein B296_00010361 [Ensete ventricosum]|uniref:Retrotransposon gag domain-containing protein n=1 Tax=Ensete ventricosum TaxID=4639 RepID=A0A427B4J5_ENSVE|nr:hypothetical protein B296_00010361 [Ensete ventricosum]
MKEFESNFLASIKPKVSLAALLSLSEKDKEPLSHFVSHFRRNHGSAPRSSLFDNASIHPSLRPQGSVGKQINIIIEGPMSGGVNTSRQRAYSQAIMEKRYSETDEPRISFLVVEAKYPTHDNALMISVYVTNTLVKRVMVDTDSSMDILYKDTFQKLGLTMTDLSPLARSLDPRL